MPAPLSPLTKGITNQEGGWFRAFRFSAGRGGAAREARFRSDEKKATGSKTQGEKGFFFGGCFYPAPPATFGPGTGLVLCGLSRTMTHKGALLTDRTISPIRVFLRLPRIS